MQASAVAIEGRALLIEGDPGSGKSSLALALIDRGAALIGDDGVTLHRQGNALIATPPPNIEGLVEVRGVGLVKYDISPPVPLGLILSLGLDPERLPAALPMRALLGLDVPVLPFDPGHIAPAVRAEYALRMHGLTSP